MSESDEKGGLQADIPAEAVAAALRSVERIAAGGEGAEAGVEVAVDAVAPGEPADADALAREVESLRAQVELSTAKGRETLEKLKDEHERLLRAAADLENFKKRAAREREDVQRFGLEKLVKDLVPVVDDLDRALAAAPPDDPLADGVRLVRAAFERALAKHGVTGFSALGQRFDPSLHEALMQVPSADQPPGTVVVEHARGFKLNDRLVRPAMVGVAVEPPAS
jgi:molecular chaperone GrpE